jgi:hypothetical protein
MTCRPSKPPAVSRDRESYFFFLATLRVFFAVFFTALFAFFAFLAFFAMLPSSVRWLLLAACTRVSTALHPEYTNGTKKTASHLKKC